MAMSSSSTPQNRRPGRLVQALRNKPLVSFFVLAYTVSWLLWIPVVILGLPVFNQATHAPPLYILPGIAIGVTGSAFLMTAVTQGRAGVRRLLQRLTWWRVGPQWFAVAVLSIPLSEVLVAVALGTPDAVRALTPAALLLYPAAYVSHFFFGPLFEESGWRGFALPRMQHRFGPLRGTMLLGLLWSGWHFLLYVPVWFQCTLGVPGDRGGNVPWVPHRWARSDPVLGGSGGGGGGLDRRAYATRPTECRHLDHEADNTAAGRKSCTAEQISHLPPTSRTAWRYRRYLCTQSTTLGSGAYAGSSRSML
ncbi:MAG: type II CAAX prenyl endopeptidase Rce1 family protein, partial [Gemmatimonadales bacterium]